MRGTLASPIIVFLFFLWAFPGQTIAADKTPVRISYVTLSLGLNKDNKSGDLRSISLSVQNLTARSLVRVQLRVVIKAATGEIIQTESFEEDFGNKTLGPGEVRQITHHIAIEGFMVNGKRGSVEVNVLDYVNDVP